MASDLAVRGEAAWSEEGRKSSSRPVDLVHLSRYTLGERDLEQEVLELFCSQSTIYIERLRRAKSDKDWKDAAHSLKGSASAIGAWRTAAAAERAESLPSQLLPEARALSLHEIEASVCEAEIYIGTLLEDR